MQIMEAVRNAVLPAGLLFRRQILEQRDRLEKLEEKVRRTDNVVRVAVNRANGAAAGIEELLRMVEAEYAGTEAGEGDGG